jgi:hypothetical protein
MKMRTRITLDIDWDTRDSDLLDPVHWNWGLLVGTEPDETVRIVTAVTKPAETPTT